MSMLRTYGVPAAALLLGGGSVGYFMQDKKPDKPVDPVVEEKEDPKPDSRPAMGSLLQYLEDKGDHIPRKRR